MVETIRTKDRMHRIALVLSAILLLALAGCGGSSASALPRHLYALRTSGTVAPANQFSESITIDDGHVTVTRGGGAAVTSGQWTFRTTWQEAFALRSLAQRIDSSDGDLIVPLPPVGGGTLSLQFGAETYWTGFQLGDYHVFSSDVQALFDAIEALPDAHGVPQPYAAAG